jgi:hypothetical protein
MNNPNAYCLDLQRASISQGARMKRKGLSPTSLLNTILIEGYDLLFYKEKKQDLHSSIIETSNQEYCPGTMNIYFIRDKLKQKRLSGIP